MGETWEVLSGARPWREDSWPPAESLGLKDQSAGQRKERRKEQMWGPRALIGAY